MAQNYWPVLEQEMDNAQFAELIAEIGTPGVAASVGGAGLLPFRTASGLFVPAGEAMSVLGAFYENTDTVQITVPLNATGANRNDLLVLRHNLAVSPVPVLTYVPGGASVPAVAATDVPLGRCVVPSGSAVPSTVADARTFTGLSVIPCRDVGDIPTWVRRTGMLAYELTANRVRFWTGTAWRTLQAADQVPVPLVRKFNSGTAGGIVDSLIVGADTPAVNYRAMVRVDARVRINLSGGTADYWAILRQAPLGQLGSTTATKIDLDVCEVKTNGGSAQVSAYVLLDEPGDRRSIGLWITRVGGGATASVNADPKLNRLDFHVTAYPGD